MLLTELYAWFVFCAAYPAYTQCLTTYALHTRHVEQPIYLPNYSAWIVQALSLKWLPGDNVFGTRYPHYPLSRTIRYSFYSIFRLCTKALSRNLWGGPHFEALVELPADDFSNVAPSLTPVDLLLLLWHWQHKKSLHVISQPEGLDKKKVKATHILSGKVSVG